MVKIVDATADGIGDQSTTDSPVPHTPQAASSPLELSVLTVIAGVAAVLRFHSLAAKSFWFDEGVSVAIARLDWYNFARILWRREANMSLYYLLLHYWLHFGGSEFFVRSLSVLFAVASVPVIYFLGCRLFDSRVGLIAAALLAINAYHVQYSQDARSYSLMVLLCLLSSLYFLKCLSEPSRHNRAAYVVASVLAVYAQFFSGLLVIAQWVSLRFLDGEQFGAQTRTKTRNDWRWIALVDIAHCRLRRDNRDRAAALGTTPRPEGSLDIRAAPYRKRGPMVAACLRGFVPGGAISSLADAQNSARTLGILALPFSSVLAASSPPVYACAVLGQAAFCSAIFYFLPARAFAPCGLRDYPASFCLAARACSFVCAYSFLSRNCGLLQAGSGHPA